MFTYDIGTALPNGATVLGYTVLPDEAGFLVLANNGGAYPYVTWLSDADGNCYWGHYHKEYEEAYADYSVRLGEYLKT